MRYFYLVTILLASIFILGGCETKRQYFEPLQTAGYIKYDGNLPASLADVQRQGATLENGQIITKKGLLDVKIPENFTFLGADSERYLASSRDSRLVIVDSSSKIIYEREFEAIVASAALGKNKLALVLGDNTSLIIDIDTNSVLFEKKGDAVYAHDAKIAAPYFLSGLVVFPTLDGKLLIVDLGSNTVIRDIVVRSEKFFSNIIYLDVLGDRLVAATKKRVVSISPKNMTFLDDEIRDVIILEDRVLIFTKDGRIVLSDADLKVLKEKKYEFASFIGTLYGKYAYIVERQGYLIAVDLDLISSNIYKLPDDISSFIYTSDDKLYYKNKYFILDKAKAKN